MIDQFTILWYLDDVGLLTAVTRTSYCPASRPVTEKVRRKALFVAAVTL